MADYFIRHVSENDDAYVLCDPEGNTVPHQVRTTLVSRSQDLPRFIVEFDASAMGGLQVIDEREGP